MGNTPVQEQPLYEQLYIRLTSMPRAARIMVSAFFALMVTLAMFPIIDWAYIKYFYNPNTVTFASIIAVVLGGVMYVAGYLLIVGTVGEKPPARKAVLWYVVIGLIALIMVVLLLLQGYSMTDGLGVNWL